MGTSKERDGFFGKYTEHFDDDGNKVGESRERDGFFGKYVEHTDADGHKTGESRNREGFFGDYTEHTDSSGSKVGESIDREGFFGDYTEHTDSEGTKIGESRKREGFFGNYTEHSGGFHPHHKPKHADSSDSASKSTVLKSNGGAYESSGYSSTESYASVSNKSSSTSEAWEFIKIALVFLAWTGGSWFLKEFCNHLLATFTQYSLAWWFTGIVWLLCWPGIIVGAIALLAISLAILVVIWIFKGIVWLIQYFVSNPY